MFRLSLLVQMAFCGLLLVSLAGVRGKATAMQPPVAAMALRLSIHVTVAAQARGMVLQPRQSSAPSTLHLLVFVDPNVLAKTGTQPLFATLIATIQAALGPGLSVDLQQTAQSMDAQLTSQLQTLAAQNGYNQAVLALGLVARNVLALENQPRPGAQLATLVPRQNQLWSTVATKQAELLQLAARRSPLVAIPSDFAALNISSGVLYGAEVTWKERWAEVWAGTAMWLYAHDPALLRQSIANAAMQGLGLLAGLPYRVATPTAAMADGLSIDTHDNTTRDRAPVRFTAAERAVVRAAFLR